MNKMNKTGYETPEMTFIELIINDKLLTASETYEMITDEDLEDTTPVSGSWK